jgi:FemAB-related protein (PEP-CTERM system-associated)
MILSGAIAIETLDDSEAARDRWDDFVRSCPSATFFHLSAWQGLIEDVFRHRTWYLYAERNGDIVAVLPLAEIKSRLFGHSLSSLPFCAYAGLAGRDTEAEELLENRAEQLARELGVQHLEYRNLVARHDAWPKQDIYVTFRRQIDGNEEANLNAIPRKQRAMVRKGIKNGSRAEIDADTSRFVALYLDNMRRHGTPPLPKRYFSELRRRFGNACEVLTIVDTAGRPVSSVMSFYFRDEVLPYYAGDDVAARDLAANDMKYWELMRHAAAKGCRIFDFGRSKVGTGPWSFKKNWGFVPQPLSYEYRLFKRDSVPQNNPLNPKYRALIAVWRRLPLSVTNVIGPRIARCLG